MPFNGSWLIRWEADHLPLNRAKLFSLGFFSSGDFFNRDGMLNELHVSHRSIVAIAEAHLQDTGVAALTIGETRANLIEQLDDNIAITKTIESQTLVGDGRLLGERDQRLNDAAQFLGLGQGGANSFVRNERAGHVAKHGSTVSRSTVELAIAVMVTHF